MRPLVGAALLAGIGAAAWAIGWSLGAFLLATGALAPLIVG